MIDLPKGWGGRKGKNKVTSNIQGDNALACVPRESHTYATTDIGGHWSVMMIAVVVLICACACTCGVEDEARGGMPQATPVAEAGLKEFRLGVHSHTMPTPSHTDPYTTFG